MATLHNDISTNSASANPDFCDGHDDLDDLDFLSCDSGEDLQPPAAAAPSRSPRATRISQTQRSHSASSAAATSRNSSVTRQVTAPFPYPYGRDGPRPGATAESFLSLGARRVGAAASQA